LAIHRGHGRCHRSPAVPVTAFARDPPEYAAALLAGGGVTWSNAA
jgi:hypothetical protein